MNYSNALTLIMESRRVPLDILAMQMYVKTDWIKKIIKKSNWKPRLDTILHICYCLEVDVFDFLKLSNENIIKNSFLLNTMPLKINNRHHQIILNLESKHIAKTLLFFRETKKITQATLSERTGFQLSAISLRESLRYTNIPTMATIELYCKAYGISLEDFIRNVFVYVDIDKSDFF